MEKRSFLIASGALLLSPSLSFSQDLSSYLLVGDEAEKVDGKVVVREFFWYGCGHCYRFEPKLKAWKDSLADSVVFEPVPVGWKNPRVDYEGHQKIFYVIKNMGLPYEVHWAVFEQMRKNPRGLNGKQAIFEFAKSLEGVDFEKFESEFNSFSVSTQVRKANALMEKFKVNSVPTLLIASKYQTSPSIAGSDEKALETASLLLKELGDK